MVVSNAPRTNKGEDAETERIAMKENVGAGNNGRAAVRVFIGLALVTVLAGLAWATVEARSQVQLVKPVARVQPATAPPDQAAPAKSAPAKPGSSQSTATKKTAAAARPAYDRALLRPALLKDKAPDVYKVKFTTTRGEFTLVVTRAWAPLGADRFYNLVKHHYYDNASVFRVVPSFVAQFGISSYPAVTAAWEKTEIKDDPVTQSNKKGYVTFATAGPNTRTTQVFINLKDNAGLDSRGFAPFGTIDAEGMKVVDMFYDQYGDSAGIDQGQIEKQGKAYLDKSFPKLDTIKAAVITDPPPSATPASAAKRDTGSSASKAAITTKKPQ
jgi:peptidyl-prolyl cis-trans isomerase A (cyclophilin A)